MVQKALNAHLPPKYGWIKDAVFNRLLLPLFPGYA
jgi:hypothetical protein